MNIQEYCAGSLALFHAISSRLSLRVLVHRHSLQVIHVVSYLRLTFEQTEFHAYKENIES
ncbi:hypothetical protein KC19_1G038700 [Ceratodon purpureus]|uniref:Uncharacterized protein n=1 Tax=Ceratodon purpureus TaxID=3225 RepID=A0A8T0J141_CERPU|nr:hypothetical protein KC19_1G038700 [Ceratodon purpureus]